MYPGDIVTLIQLVQVKKKMNRKVRVQFGLKKWGGPNTQNRFPHRS